MNEGETTAREDVKTVGASTTSSDQLESMVKNKLVADQVDGYRLAIAVAIALNKLPQLDRRTARTTKFAAGNLDPDQELKTVVAELYPDFRSTPYRALEDLAEQGLTELSNRTEGDVLWFGPLIDQVTEANS